MSDQKEEQRRVVPMKNLPSFVRGPDKCRFPTRVLEYSPHRLAESTVLTPRGQRVCEKSRVHERVTWPTGPGQRRAARAMARTLEDELFGLSAPLARLLIAIAHSVEQVAEALRFPQPASAEDASDVARNQFGDVQTQADLEADAIVTKCLRESQCVSTAYSEEQAEAIVMGFHGYCVAFDPLDGSSVLGADFAVGSIFGVWPGEDLSGLKGRDQVAAAYAVYGPRTVLVMATPTPENGPSDRGGDASVGRMRVKEFVLGKEGRWVLTRDGLRIEERSVFAPGNVKATADNAKYREQVARWMGGRYTLRYSGSMAADVHHILNKGGGVFCNPASLTSPAKLRLLFECAPLSLIVTAAGGAATDGAVDILDLPVDQTDKRTGIALGSRAEVEQCRAALQQA